MDASEVGASCWRHTGLSRRRWSWSTGRLLRCTLVASLYAVALAGFILFQITAAQVYQNFQTIKRTIQLGQPLLHSINLFNATRWVVLGTGLLVFCLFPVIITFAHRSSTRIFEANWGRGERDGMKKRSRVIRILLAILFFAISITLIVAVVSIATNVRAEAKLSEMDDKLQSSSNLLSRVSTTLTSLREASSGSSASSPGTQSGSSDGLGSLLSSFLGSSNSSTGNGISSLLQGLTGSTGNSSQSGGILNSIISSVLQSSSGSGNANFAKFLTAENLPVLLPLLSGLNVGTLVRMLDTSPQGVLQLAAILGNLIQLDSGNTGLTCPNTCLSYGDACICTTSQISTLRPMYGPAVRDVRRALTGSCIFAFGCGLLLLAVGQCLARFGFLEALVYGNRYDRYLAVMNAMQARGNSEPEVAPMRLNKIYDTKSAESTPRPIDVQASIP